MTKLDLEARMTIKTLHKKGVPNTRIARILGTAESAVRYHLKRQAEGAEDGRRKQPQKAAELHEVITTWRSVQDGRFNLAALHDFLVREHGYKGSLRSVQRYYRRHFPAPKVRARRRVETPPGAQAQVDWAHFPCVMIGGQPRYLYALHLQLSFSRFGAIVWSPGRDQLAWQGAHNDAFRRLDGVPATVRIDNEKTGVSHGAGAWGEINASYRRYAETVRFHVDACPPRAPQAKGKIERRILDHRLSIDPTKRHWDCVEQLQEWTDKRTLEAAGKRVCPITGKSVLESWQEEKKSLAALPVLPEPFDIVVRRPVGQDCMVSFEARLYSVPFEHVGRSVEVHGCNGVVQFLAGNDVVACHPRGTRERILIDPSHFEGEATDRVLPPVPLGRMGRRLAEIAAMTPEKRPIDLYAELAEVAR